MLARIRAARARRYVVTYFSHVDPGVSSPCMGGIAYRTRRAAEREAFRLASLNARGGEYGVRRVS